MQTNKEEITNKKHDTITKTNKSKHFSNAVQLLRQQQYDAHTKKHKNYTIKQNTQNYTNKQNTQNYTNKQNTQNYTEKQNYNKTKQNYKTNKQTNRQCNGDHLLCGCDNSKDAVGEVTAYCVYTFQRLLVFTAMTNIVEFTALTYSCNNPKETNDWCHLYAVN